jgi:hypothetical protein
LKKTLKSGAQIERQYFKSKSFLLLTLRNIVSRGDLILDNNYIISVIPFTSWKMSRANGEIEVLYEKDEKEREGPYFIEQQCTSTVYLLAGKSRTCAAIHITYARFILSYLERKRASFDK